MLASGTSMTLWAVHISDSVLQRGWLVGGFVLMGVLLLIGGWRTREEDVPITALLAAAFFVASLIHVRIGPSSAHLLLNGLLGVTLGRRAALAIPVGLTLQAALLHHGGFEALGVNSVVMTLPALAAGCLFGLLRNRDHAPWLVALSILSGVFSVAFSIALLVTNPPGAGTEFDLEPASALVLHPGFLAGALLLAALGGYFARRQGLSSEYALGLLVGHVTVLLTLALETTALVLGGKEDWRTLAVLLCVIHLPIAAIEGVVLGFTAGFLARVKPELLGRTESETPCVDASTP